MENIERQFSEVGLRCQLATRPIVATGNSDIIQMDIRTHKGKEEFLIWQGHKDNYIQVLGKDKSFQQLVLVAKEPSRDFVQTEHFAWYKTRGDMQEKLANFLLLHNIRQDRVVSTDMKKGKVTFRSKTPEGKRHFLAGMDECHYFMTILAQPVATVMQAHNALRAVGLRKTDDFKRQGEWFFTEATGLADWEIKQGIIRKKTPIGAGGKPHVADEVLRLRDGRVFVRGKVRHPDHKTKKFSQWMLVRRNREEAFRGAKWVD